MSDMLNMDSLNCLSEVTEGDCKANSATATAGDSFRSIDYTEEDSLSTEQCSELSDRQDKSPLFLIRDRCWLCQCARKDEEESDSDDEDSSTKSTDGVLHELLPWLCKNCERVVEEEERKTEPTPMTDIDGLSDMSTNSTCMCDACLKARAAEAEKERLSLELDQVWAELSNVVRAVYHLDSYPADADTVNSDRLSGFVSRLCEHDADELFQRLESQVREVVIEMKVRLLRELTADHKVEPRAHQFVTLLLSEYADLCASSRHATFLATFEEKHLKQFNLTWQLHNKHLFHSVIYSDPVVQNCMPKVLSHIRQSVSVEDAGSEQYGKTLSDYDKFDSEMSVVSAIWNDCKRLIEAYNEKQAALKLKQKMFKEDWAFFKAQRRLLEQTLPKHRQTASSCHSCFDVQFNEMMMKILQGKNVEDSHCPTCRQPRCPCDECNISHLITCGLISPEVSEQQHHHHHHHDHSEAEHQQPPDHNSNDVTCNDDTSQLSASRYDSLRSYYVNIKPPSVPSSDSGSSSQSPIILDRCRFFGENFDFANDIGSAADDDYDLFADAVKCHDPPAVGVPATELEQEKDAVCDGESRLREVRPSSLVARMMMTAVDLSADPSTCTCPHCKMNNGTPCLFEAARRGLSAPKPSVDHLQLTQLPTSRRLLNPQLYDDSLESTSATNDGGKQTEDTMGKNDIDKLSSKIIGDAVNDLELNGQSISDQEDIWSDCTAELHPSEEKNSVDGVGKNCFPTKNESCGGRKESAGKTAKPSETDERNVTEAVTTCEPPHQPLSTSCVSTAPTETATPCTTAAIPGTVTTTTVDKPTGAATAKSTTASKMMSTTACTTSLTSTTSSGKSERPRASPCRSSQTKPVTNGRESKPPCTASSTATPSAKQPSPSLSNAAAAKLLVDMVSRSKSTAAVNTSSSGGVGQCKLTQCADKMHSDSASNVCASAEGADGGSCTAEKSSRNATAGGAAGDRKDGKFCECWHCEFFGHMSQSTLPPSRNYTETRDRLRAQLQKRKEKKKQTESGGADHQSPAESPRPAVHSAPSAGSMSTLLDDKEVEEIIRFINGVDSSVTSSPSAVSTAAKQKTKQKCRKGRDAASKSVASDVAAKSGSGPSDSSTSSVLSPSQTKKTATITTPGRDVSKVELVAQLSSRLAKLTDAATASNVSRPHPTTTRTNVTDQQASSPSTESSSRTQSVLKTSNKPGDREGSATKQRNPGSGVSRPETMLANHNNKNSNLQQHTQTTCKGKRQKNGNELPDLPVDDIFLPSDETCRSEAADDFDREIEEFKRFCQTSCQTPKQERPRVALNLKDIFARKKSHLTT